MLTRLVVVFTLIAVPAIAEEPAAKDAPIDPEAQTLIDAFFAAHEKMKDTTYLLDKFERMRDGEVVKEQLFVKLRMKPSYAVYLARTKPERGMEALYKQGGDMTGHTGNFPDLTIDIDPEGSLAMDDQHHPIYGTGQASVVKRFELAKPLAEKGKLTIRKVADQTVGGVNASCVEVKASVGSWKVKAKDDESLFVLAKRANTWPYLIYRDNAEIDDLTDELDEGQSVRIPGYYAKRIEICFDPKNHLVVREKYFDKKGLFEHYDTIERKVNVGLSAKDFDPDNKEYDF